MAVGSEIPALGDRGSAPRVNTRVVAHLRSFIDTGALQPGDQLPPERELARRLNVSRPNLRAGIAFLGMIGVLKICHGTGTYVFFGHGSCHPIPHRCQESSNAPSPRSYLKRVV